MTFTTFDSYVEWCESVEGLDIEIPENEDDTVVIVDLEETNTLVVVEALLSAYDSGFHLGGYFAKFGGSIMVYED